MENMGEVFTCQVCKEIGNEEEIGNEDGLHVHKLCSNPPDFVDHPFYEHRRFHFCRKRRQFQQCDACGGDIKGANYQCYDNGKDLHPCCAHLPPRLQDNHGGGGATEGQQVALVLRPELSSECSICGKVKIEGLKTWYYKTCESNKLRFHVACVKKVLAQIIYNNMEEGSLSVLAAPDKTSAVKKKKKEDSLWEKIWKKALTMILTALIGQILPIGAEAIADGITNMIAKFIKFLKRRR